MDRFRCARGTSNTENYHKPVRDLLAGFGTSPRMAHSVLVPFNYRRNHLWQVSWIQLDSVVVTLCYTLGDALDDSSYIELGESRYYVCGYIAVSAYREVWGRVCPCGRALEIGTSLH